ncbi:M3 family metallopeptidase [Kordiimonas sp. SCSIO 12610]|uniref:M3 family metallopeptidase n=1 Tax=Kordiimonas sp. SCSIO 12610 TaxID=2829597 RepID=UPI00210BEE04|nr:M3 family metallopeptidase [Kordiimonas sp. SCSIO 12610]UTW56060.1 M3 family metallopeptidase [Kordiimonas sp. SCSIO 12610]
MKQTPFKNQIKNQIRIGVSALALFLAACSEVANNSANEESENVSEVSEAIEAPNFLLAEWQGPYGGIPDFTKAKLSDLKAGLETGMAENLAEIEAIANNPDAPTFENTIVAMEDTGRALSRLFAYYGIWASNNSTPEFREIQREVAPKLSAFNSKITQNDKLFARVKAVYEGEEMKSLRPDQQRLVWLTYDGFASFGATLTGDAKNRYAAINQELAGLHTNFANNVLADEEGYVLYLTEDQLGGLPQSYIDAAAAAAKSRGEEGKFAVTNTRSSMDPFLTFSTERDLREKVWNTYYSRGDNADDKDNNANIAKILKLRDERVKLLGYDNYASWRLQNRMAKTPDRALELMEAVWPAAIARVREEVADMQAVADSENAGIKIAPWDYRFYAEKVRKAKYDLDSNEVKQYLQVDKLIEAMHFVAGELFNFGFTPITDGSVPVFHEDVKVWEVTDKTSGEHIGLWYLDPYARAGKRSGAWARSFRGHETFDGKQTVLSTNNSNFVKGAAGAPTLVSWDDATTFFHEFGHALHALSSNVVYPTLNGGVRDYTEFQSQLLERWLSTDEVINTYLLHVETGEPMPKALVDKIKAAGNFNQGFATTEYLASALVDMRFHTAEDVSNLDADAFEREALAALDMPSELVMRHRSPHFGHIFSGEGYSAGYYGYMWADVLTSDAAEAFREAPGGFYDKDVAKRLVDNLFAVRNAVDPEEAYRAFRGRDAKIEALMRDRGFPVPE